MRQGGKGGKRERWGKGLNFTNKDFFFIFGSLVFFEMISEKKNDLKMIFVYFFDR